MPFEKTATFTGHRSGIYVLAHAERRHAFFSGGGDGQVVRWSLEHPDHGELVTSVDDAVFALHFDHAHHLLLMGRQDGGLHVIDMAEKREAKLVEVHRKGIHAIVALHKGRVITLGGDGSLGLWQLPEAVLLRQIPLEETKLRAAVVNEAANTIIIAAGDGRLHELELDDLNEVRTLQAHEGGVTALALHPSKPVIVSGGKDGFLRAWPSTSGTDPVLEIPAHRSTVYGIAFNADGSTIATASRDKTVKLWDANSFDPITRLDRSAGGHGYSVNTLLWVNGDLVTAGDDRTIIAWAQKG